MVNIFEVERELRALRGKQIPSWVPLVLLLVSLALFAAVRILQGHAAWLGIIIVILLIHEAGHWIGMKYFGCRDVRMFFIPFFGAAVSGQNQTHLGYQQAIVSLLGPIPGIVIGILGAATFQLVDHSTFTRAVQLILLLNLFNLLPVHPLDGSRLLEHTVFSRSAAAAFAFKVVGVSAMGYLAYAARSKFLGYFTYILLLSLKSEYMRMRIIRRLCKANIKAEEDSVQVIPREAIKLMLPDLNVTFFGSYNSPRGIAKYALSIWESIAEIPPSPGEVVLILVVYAFFLGLGIYGLSLLGFDVARLIR